MVTGENGGGGEEEEPEKKSKERREKDRKALRMRRINSLKRQINIKEKMLEVQLIHFLSTFPTNISNRCIHLPASSACPRIVLEM